jgi:hypothetical protein
MPLVDEFVLSPSWADSAERGDHHFDQGAATEIGYTDRVLQ